jgi:hypothetical protein
MKVGDQYRGSYLLRLKRSLLQNDSVLCSFPNCYDIQFLINAVAMMGVAVLARMGGSRNA